MLGSHSQPRFSQPLCGQYSPDRGSLPGHLSDASARTWWTTLPRRPLPRAASQPELGFSGTTVTPRRDAGLQPPVSLLLWAPQSHLPLRRLQPSQPRRMPPSLTAALGTIPAVHWLLPRQPRATPLPIGPALLRAIFVRGLGQRSERGVGLSLPSHLRNPNRKGGPRLHLSRDPQAETLIPREPERVFKVATSSRGRSVQHRRS
ncbi:uncharacterized protein LOC132655845 [Meriones unguiculatus]|uniref:uncharacterized protein LOC132655845 n=1 Tax=Meriones unguiculatus TaxID=10047 RepID=UPI00293EF22D|nr:uncharacterized protein LOC132655845 [Meriones unguiculatus]